MPRHLIRRSLLLVSPLDRSAVEQAWTNNADAIVLDLASVSPHERADARETVRGSVPMLRRGGADILVRVAPESAPADIEASVRPGVNGVILTYPETPESVRAAHEAVDAAEAAHGVEEGSTEIGLILGTAKAVWDIREVMTASLRVSMVGLDERHLALTMGLVVAPDLDPFKYCVRGRFVAEAASADRVLFGPYGIHRLGVGFPLSCLYGPDSPEDEVFRSARWGRDIGMNGALCPYPAWVEQCNRAFVPTDEEIANHRQLIEAYTVGVAAGRGAVPLGGGRFVERPQVELAKAIISFRERCDRRDAEKAAAAAAGAG